MFVESAGMVWFELVWLGSMLIKSGFFIPIYNWVSVIPIYIISGPKFSNIEIIFALSTFKMFLSLRFSTWFPVSFFVVPFYVNTLLTNSNMLQLLSLVLINHGHGLPMALDGLIEILSYKFRPKSTIILLSLFLLPMGKTKHRVPVFQWKWLFG